LRIDSVQEGLMAAKKSTRGKTTVNKSSVSGRFVKKTTVAKSPKTTYKQTVKRKPAK
jgi:hypothetical protein